MSVPSDCIRDWCLAPEAWDSGSISHHSIRHIPFTAPAALRRLSNSTCNSLLAVTKLGLHSPSLKNKALSQHEPRAWQPETVDSVLFTQNTHSKGDLAQEEAVTSWQVPPRAAAVPPLLVAGVPSPMWQGDLSPATLLRSSPFHSLPLVLALPEAGQGVGQGWRAHQEHSEPRTGEEGPKFKEVIAGLREHRAVWCLGAVGRVWRAGIWCVAPPGQTVPSVLFTFLVTISEGLESLERKFLFFFFF